MKVWWMRHGNARKQLAQETDFQRKLTLMGEEETRAIARFLLPYLNGRIEVVASPLVRTQQTAQLVHDVWQDCGMTTTMMSLEYLAHAPWIPLASYLKARSAVGVDTLLLVSHQPFLEGWLADLVGLSVTIVPSTVVMTTWKENKWTLDAVVTPALWR